MISGATGALAVVMVALVADHGVEYLFATVVLMGLLQILAGCLKLGKFIRMVPSSRHARFPERPGNSVIFLPTQPVWRQRRARLDLNTFMEGTIIDVAWLQGEQLYLLFRFGMFNHGYHSFLPRFTTAIPSSLAAIVVVSLLVVSLDLDTGWWRHRINQAACPAFTYRWCHSTLKHYMDNPTLLNHFSRHWLN